MLESLLTVYCFLQELKAFFDAYRRQFRQDLTRANHRNKRLVEELVVRHDDWLAEPKVVSHNQKSMLIGSYDDSHAGRNVWVYSSHLLSGLANDCVTRRKAHVTIEVVVEQVASIKTLGERLVRPIAPVYAVVDVRRARVILLLLDRIKVCVLLANLLAPIMQVPVVAEPCNTCNLGVELECLPVRGH